MDIFWIKCAKMKFMSIYLKARTAKEKMSREKAVSLLCVENLTEYNCVHPIQKNLLLKPVKEEINLSLISH